MRADEIALAAASLVLLFLISGCANTTAPSGYLGSAEEAQKEAYGAWISLEYEAGSLEMVVEGEFIALAQDSVFLLTRVLGRDTLVGIPLDQTKGGRLTTYDAKHGWLGAWTALGSLSTMSHGVGLIISLPAWIILGSASTASQSWAPIEKIRVDSWHDLRKFARFPQGLPQRLDRSTLRGKWK